METGEQRDKQGRCKMLPRSYGGIASHEPANEVQKEAASYCREDTRIRARNQAKKVGGRDGSLSGT